MANMMKSMVSRTGNMILVIFPMTLVLALIATNLLVEDTRTTMAGYALLGTKKVGDATQLGLSVALLFQFTPVVLGYWFTRDTRNWYLAAISMLCLTMDIGYDFQYKASGFTTIGWYEAAITLTESLAIYTLGSEVLFTLAWGYLFEGADEFGVAAGGAIAKIIKMVSKMFEGSIVGMKSMASALGKLAPSDDEEEQTVGVTVNGKPQPDMFGSRKS